MGPRPSNKGLVQGSPLSQLLFNIFTAEIHTKIMKDKKFIQYADDFVIPCAGMTLIGINNYQPIRGNLHMDISKWVEFVHIEI